MSTGQTAELFTAVLCNLNERRLEIGLMNLVQSSSPPFRFPQNLLPIRWGLLGEGKFMEKGETGA